VTVFFETYVQPAVAGGSIIYWGLRREFKDRGPYLFTVYWAETASSTEWSAVPGANVVDTYWATDPIQRVYAKEHESYYKIVLTSAEGTYASEPFNAAGKLDKRHWLLAREVCRKERLAFTKFGGMVGQLFKRKIWGERCVCADISTGESTDPDCELCYGTAVTGGYWDGYTTYCLDQSGRLNRDRTIQEQMSTTEMVVTGTRFLAYPHITSHDLWFNEGTGDIWVVRKVEDTVNILGVPIVYAAELRLLPYTDIAYKLVGAPEVPDNGYEEYTGGDSESGDPAVEPASEWSTISAYTQFICVWTGNGWTIGPASGDQLVTELYTTTTDSFSYHKLPTYTWAGVWPGGGDLTVVLEASGNLTISGSVVTVLNGGYTALGYANGGPVYIHDVA